MSDIAFDPALDLKLERDVPVAPELLWRGWTEPELLKQWFCPTPWRVTDAEIDLRPGGAFRTKMEGPNGEVMDGSAGCWLEVVPNRRLSWTDALGPGFRPRADPFLSATICFDQLPDGTRYRAYAFHQTAEARQQHAEMGFEQGCNTALDQLIALAGKLAEEPAGK